MNSVILTLIAAVLTGLVTDLLFHDSLFKSVPWGLSLFVWLVMLTLASLTLICRTKPTSRWKSSWFLVPPLFLAAGCVWRDSPVLRSLDVGVIFFFLGLTAISVMGLRVSTAGVVHYLLTPVQFAEQLLFSPFVFIAKEIGWREMLSETTRTRIRQVARGLLLAIPLVCVFGGLFASADAAFEGILRKGLQIDSGQFFQHSMLTAISIFCASGFFRCMSIGEISKRFAPEDIKSQPKSLSLGQVEVGVILGLLNLLFLSFVVVQARYFFGGANLIEVTSNLTYSEYARRGFFELVTVTVLVIPVLLYLDWAVSKASQAGLVLVRALNASQIVMLFIIMLSAVERMRLYQSEYGQTELRFYTTAFMGWIAVVCIVFCVTVLRDQRKYFAISSLISGVVVLGTLHCLNPDDHIVRSNIDFMKQGHRFDVEYALTLSNDAIPALMDNLTALPLNDRQVVRDRFGGQLAHAWQADWRAINWSRMQAYDAVEKGLGTKSPPAADVNSLRLRQDANSTCTGD